MVNNFFVSATTGLGGNTLSTGSSLFGNTQAKPGGLFGANTGTGLFGATSTFGASTGTTFGSSLGAPSLFGYVEVSHNR